MYIPSVCITSSRRLTYLPLKTIPVPPMKGFMSHLSTSSWSAAGSRIFAASSAAQRLRPPTGNGITHSVANFSSLNTWRSEGQTVTPNLSINLFVLMNQRTRRTPFVSSQYQLSRVLIRGGHKSLQIKSRAIQIIRFTCHWVAKINDIYMGTYFVRENRST